MNTEEQSLNTSQSSMIKEHKISKYQNIITCEKKHSRNVAYWIVVTLTLLLTTLISVIYSIHTQKIKLIYAILAPFFVDAYVLAGLGEIAFFMRVILPSSLWNCENPFFRVREKESGVYRKLKIMAWKDRIPEMGWTGGFQKREVTSLTPEYLEKFLRETCFAEAMHIIAGLFGFTVFLFFDSSTIFIAVPLVLINLILHALPCIVQRFTRYRLFRVYMHVLDRYKITINNE